MLKLLGFSKVVKKALYLLLLDFHRFVAGEDLDFEVFDRLQKLENLFVFFVQIVVHWV